ncbi:putative toxin-antitoxin system toxin component, PIN family [Prevotella sp. P6B1]|uniref:PIN domain-containing protein n=1 Tax=Prevotella sp. P6B1 TaxID=1410613 RepID=UPI00051BDB0B|nr:PIN domain-containing protein [Prevotella sp. P6B1]
MIYAVIDTNVLVSALITHNPQAATSTVVGLMLQGAFTPLYDGDVIEEYREVLHRDKFKLLPAVVDALISYIIEHGVEMSRTAFPEPLPDEDDRVFYEIALTNEDSFLVTGNLKHYPDTPKVITPADFLKVVLEK